MSWSVCCVGVIAMAGMESNIKQQVFLSIVAASGVAAVHFSDMFDGLNCICESNTSSRNLCLSVRIDRATVPAGRLASCTSDRDCQRRNTDWHGFYWSSSIFRHDCSRQIG